MVGEIRIKGEDVRSRSVKRVGAVLGAVAMVVVSIAIRNAIDDDGDRGGGSGSLRCATELAAACGQLAGDTDIDVVVEHAGATAAALVDPAATPESLGFDGWIVPGPWPDIVREERERQGLGPLLDAPTDPIARSPLVLAVRTQREDVLTEACEGPIEWRCLGDQSGRPWADLPGGQAAWGPVRVGHADPTTSAVGLLVLGQAASQYLRDVVEDPADLSTNVLDAPELQFLSWLTRLEDSGPAPPFDQFVTTPAFDAVGTVEAEAGPVLADAAPDRRDAITLLYLEPVSTADVVFAAVVGRGDGLEAGVTGDDARQALADAGWRVSGQDRAEGVGEEPRLPRPANLPSPGVLQALQDRWREVT